VKSGDVNIKIPLAYELPLRAAIAAYPNPVGQQVFVPVLEVNLIYLHISTAIICL
jgi:hypothetical protein